MDKWTSIDGVKFRYQPDGGYFEIKAIDKTPDNITESQLAIFYKDLKDAIVHVQYVDSDFESLNSMFERGAERYEKFNLSFYNADVRANILQRLGLRDGMLLKNAPTDKTYELRYDPVKHCLRVDQRLELEGPPR